MFHYATRVAFLNFVRNVNQVHTHTPAACLQLVVQVVEEEGGDMMETVRRKHRLAVCANCPAFEDIVGPGNLSPLAERMRNLHDAGGGDFTLLLGEWRVSLPR